MHGNMHGWYLIALVTELVFKLTLRVSAVRRWTDVSCAKHPELQVVLLEGKEKEETPTHTILPLPSYRSLSHQR